MPAKCFNNRITYIILTVIFLSHHVYADKVAVWNNYTGICTNIEIWFPNDRDVARLKNCSVVEGFVRLVNLDLRNLDTNFSFPLLKEITDYLFLFRVTGLASIGQLFPNLSLIRGNQLFQNYALIIFELFDLEALGLFSLNDIVKGGLFIAQNRKLCFVDTLDLNAIAHGERKHYIAKNKNPYECPLCPEHCPVSDSGKQFCWDKEHCQKHCPQNCPSCQSNGVCCNAECLGGCYESDINHCFSCKHLTVKNECQPTCPSNRVEYLNRCILESDCYSVQKSLDLFHQYWKLHNNKCLQECPAGYHEREEYFDNHKRAVCNKCENDKCRKVCPSAIITSIEDAQKLTDCTVIKGKLIIRVSGNIIEGLENHLRNIEEITEYLKVVYSHQLTSLNFLKNLKMIGGITHNGEKAAYSLVVMDNKNLVMLWDWQSRESKLHINGSLFFHINPKLCRAKIKELIVETDMKEEDVDNSFLSDMTNGVKTVCNITELEVAVSNISSDSALVTWKQFEFHDLRKLLGYLLFYKEAPFQNVTIYDRRYTCGEGGWRVEDTFFYEVEKERKEVNLKKEVNFSISRLKHYTQYAFFVKTVTVDADLEAQSTIHYFQTLPSSPSEPVDLSADTNSSSELFISWNPPLYPNGNVTHYKVSVFLIEDQENLEMNCEAQDTLSDNFTFETYGGRTDSEGNTYFHYSSRRDNQRVQTAEERERARQRGIDFEDQLYNHIYIKRFSSRRKRETSSVKNELSKSNKLLSPFVVETVYGTSKQIPGLQHYSNYKITVAACREWEESEERTAEDNCSKERVVYQRTKPIPEADTLQEIYPLIEVSNKTSGTVTLKWEDPPNPNGFIKAYVIEYKKDDAAPIIDCISKKDLFFDKSYSLKNLRPGNYSIRLKVESLSGAGSFTSFKYFIIPDESLFSQYFYWIMGAIGCISPPVLFFMLYYVHSSGQKDKLILSVNPEYVTSSYVPDSWEIPRMQVELLNEIGQGSFGMVYDGLLNLEGGGTKKCAIKTVNPQASDREKLEFLNEASVMKAFDTYHVVKLLGVVSQGEPAFVVMELMANGDLKSFLRSRRPDTVDPQIRPPSLRRLLQMCAEIADGMAYLSAKKYVHRDLAARNCMVSEDLTVKIGDFGMARDIYEGDYYRKGSKGLMPVRWMAPESLRDGIFLTLSDVWSYGIVLYEIVTLAAQPYQGLTNDQVLRYILDGGIIEQPENCPDKLYQLMKRCWRQQPSERPSFLELVTLLYEDVSLKFHSVSYYDSEEGKQQRRLAETNSDLL